MIFNTGGDGRRTGGCGMRAILALVILIGGFATYYMNKQKNPVTGQEQHVSLTPDQEVRLGLESAPEMAAQMGGLVPREDPRARLVSSLGERMVAALPEHPFRFEFHLLRDPETVNAFALPGGQVFITLGLMQRLSNEAQVAGVVGHEIGHVIERHGAEHMATAQFYQSIVGATAVGTGDQRAAAVAQYVSQIRQLKYGRGDELESDEWGLKLMEQVGYDPREMLKVMAVLKEAAGGRGGSEMMSSHPLPESRIARIEEYVKQKYPQGVPSGLGTGKVLWRERIAGD
jgi:predicted Zn-dependent protease